MSFGGGSSGRGEGDGSKVSFTSHTTRGGTMGDKGSIRSSLHNDPVHVDNDVLEMAEEISEDMDNLDWGALNPASLSNKQLVSFSQEDIAAEFEERVAHLQLQLEEVQEAAEAARREWSAKCSELEIQNSVKETEVASLRGEVESLKGQLAQVKRTKWSEVTDHDTIKLIEDEVLEMMEQRDQEIDAYKEIKEEEIRLVKSRYFQDLDHHADQVGDHLQHVKKTARLYASLSHSGGMPLHGLLSDPLGMLQLLHTIDEDIYERVLQKVVRPVPHLADKEHANGGIEVPDLPALRETLRAYQEQDKLLMAQAGITMDTPEGDAGQEREGADGTDREQLGEHLHRLQEGLGDLAKLIEGGETLPLEAVKEMSQVAVEVARGVESQHRATHPAERYTLLRKDPLLASLVNSELADRLEAILRENEKLRACLRLQGRSRNAGLSPEMLQQKQDDLLAHVEDLEKEAERLNIKCRRLELQRLELKEARKKAMEELAAAEAASPTNKRQSRNFGAVLPPTIADETDSEEVASIVEDVSEISDVFDPEEEMAADQIAGVEEIVEEPEDELPDQFEMEKKQFASTMRKEAHVASLVEQILQYLECGTFLFRVERGQVTKDYAYLAANRSVINICAVHEGKPDRKRSLHMVMLRDVKEIILGQYSDPFKRLLKESGNTPADPQALHTVPKDSDGVEVYNTGLYFYRSITLKMRKGRTFDCICNTDNDFETWVVALHRITTLDPRYGKPLEDVRFFKGYEALEEDEKAFCEANHVPPLLYLNAKTQCLKQEYKIYLTLYDVRTLSGFDLLHSQKVFELWLLQSWIEKQHVYQIRYLEFFPDERSNLLAIVDAERKRERKKEADRLLHGN